MDERDDSQDQMDFSTEELRPVDDQWEAEEYIEDGGPKNLLLWVGGGVLAVLIIAAFFLFGSSRTTGPVTDLSGVNERLEQLNERLADLDEALTVVNDKLSKIQTITSEEAVALGEVNQKVERLAQQVVSMSSRLESDRAKASSSAASKPAKKATSTTTAAAPKSTSTTKKTAAPAARRYHTVKSGDTLYGIGRKYSLTVAQIKSINNLTSNTLKLGQKIYLEK